MTTAWAPAQLQRFHDAEELEIAVRRGDGTLRRRLPVWTVRVGDAVYVRTWYRRGTGWFGHAVTTRRARVRVPGVEADVAVRDVGDGPDGQRAAVDHAYLAKYGRYGRSSVEAMVGDAAAATTLRLDPEPTAEGSHVVGRSSEGWEEDRY